MYGGKSLMEFKIKGSVLSEDSFILTSEELDVYKIGLEIVRDYIATKEKEETEAKGSV